MASFLDQYGVEEERRARILKRIAVAVLVLALGGGAAYWRFRDYREERQVKRFLELLRHQNYQAAYELWGCTAEHPCREYSFEKFLEDWGPKAPHGDIAAARLAGKRSCEGGIIQTLRFGPNDEVWLWVDRANRNLGYAPWPVCNPRIPIPRGTPAP